MNATISNPGTKIESRELNDSELDDVSGGVLWFFIGLAIGTGTTMTVMSELSPKGTLNSLNLNR
jgi:hypothetical protein